MTVHMKSNSFIVYMKQHWNIVLQYMSICLTTKRAVSQQEYPGVFLWGFFCIFSRILVFACFAADVECCSRQKKSNNHEMHFSICSLLKCSNVPDEHQKETFRRKGNLSACCTPRQILFVVGMAHAIHHPEE